MDINVRRIELAQHILNTTDVNLINSISKLFKKANVDISRNTNPLTIEELNQRIDKSEEDFKNGKTIDSDAMYDKYINATL